LARWTFRISFFLILGVVTTVGVAWGGLLTCRLHGQCELPADAVRMQSVFANLELAAPLLRDSFGDAEFSMREGMLDLRISGGGAFVMRRDPMIEPPSIAISSGWPKEALTANVRGDDEITDGVDARETFLVNGGYGVLPLRPIVPGFLVNTLFYSGVWFGIFSGVGFLKRVLRRKRGRCVKCSYDLRGELDKGCPECGWGRE